MNLPACLQIHISAFIFVLFIPVRTSFDLFCLKDTFNALRPLKLTVGKHIKKYFQRHCFRDKNLPNAIQQNMSLWPRMNLPY